MATATATSQHPPEQASLLRMVRASRAPRLRPLEQFAREELILPDGPDAGFRWSPDRLPWQRLWFAALDSGRYNEAAGVGTTQAGKTLAMWVVPIMHHLFERGETVVAGVPTMEIARDKWQIDLRPAIFASRYRALLPDRGLGSGGGMSDLITFRNGAALKFMSGGGDDKSRASFTARVVAITETDGLDLSAGTSREADKVTQLKARARAYGEQRQIYYECTASIEAGRIWQEYTHGTQSRIVSPCPHCEAWVAPEREHLAGWQGAQSALEAAEKAFFACPSCGEALSDRDRLAMNSDARLVHRGQSIDRKGRIKGIHPPTRTLGFRFSAFHNLFASPADIAADEWRAPRSPDADNRERELRQFVWALPAQPALSEDVPLTLDGLAGRSLEGLRQGFVPGDTEWLTLAIDIGKWRCHWVLIAWRQDGRAHVVTYDTFLVESDKLGLDQALIAALRTFRDEVVLPGWPRAGDEAKRYVPDQVWIDAGYATDVVYQFCREAGRGRFRPCVGRGAGQEHQQWQQRIKASGSTVEFKGDGYHISHLKRDHIHLVEVNADTWKSWVHRRLATPLDKPGALTFYEARPQEHQAYCKHLTAERRVEEFKAGKGMLNRWERVNRDNHWFDATYLACAAGHFCGVRLVDSPPPPAAAAEPKRHRFTTPDGRPYLITER